MVDPTPRLSDQQKVCLRLVGRGMTSKEIAIETGLAPQTVDTYLKAAMSRLGAVNRRDAARLLASTELPQELASPPQVVGDPPVDGQVGFATAGRDWAGLITLPPLGGRLNKLTFRERTEAVLKVAAAGVVAVLALALVIAAALRTFR